MLFYSIRSTKIQTEVTSVKVIKNSVYIKSSSLIRSKCYNTRIWVWNWGKLLRKQHKNCRGYKRFGVTKAKRTKSITISPRPPTNHLLCQHRNGKLLFAVWRARSVEIGASIAASSQHDYNSLATAVYRRQVNTVIWMALSTTVLPFPENIASRWGSLLVRKCRQLRNWRRVQNAYANDEKLGLLSPLSLYHSTLGPPDLSDYRNTSRNYRNPFSSFNTHSSDLHPSRNARTTPW